jgi:hypothetical protein
MVERSGTGWNTESGEMPDSNTAALNGEMSRQDAADERRERLLKRYPLASFEDEAWLHFYDPAHEAVVDLVLAHPDAVAFALCRFAGLSRGYYTSSDMQISRDVSNLRHWINDWIAAEMEKLQAEKIEGEI